MTRNYLIGHGEQLVEPTKRPAIVPDKAHPYSVDDARRRIVPQLNTVLASLQPGPTSPDDVHVLRVALHPAYVAKSYFPAELLREAGLEAVGSRGAVMRPSSHTRKEWQDADFGTSELFIAGRRADFRNLAERLDSDDALPKQYEQIREIESISGFSSSEKLHQGDGAGPTGGFEIVVHLPSRRLAPNNREQFLAYAAQHGFDVRDELGFEVRGLWFLPAIGSAERMRDIAEFATVRTVRPMPALSVSPLPRTVTLSDIPVRLPRAGVLSAEPRVAILDGGLPRSHSIADWVGSYREMDPAADNHRGYEQHGLAVASAFLFGPLSATGVAPQPPAKIDVFRILDSSTASEDALELYKTLGHVEEILLTRSYDYINLSLGPTLPVEDDDVHAWTALIDSLIGDGKTLMTVAVGNNGQSDLDSGNSRIQVPADSVNALAVGASDRSGVDWERAAYSAVGPGRMPGVVKPDVLIHGGSALDYFHVLSDGEDPVLLPATGTSLAAPFALRHAVAMRSLLGSELTPLGTRALLIHGAEASGRDRREVGWGRVPVDYEDLVTSGDGVARVVYQGVVSPGKYIRARVPTPKSGLTGRVRLTATFCFATPVDVQAPDVYTRAGLEVRFRPNSHAVKTGSKTPSSRGFFSPASFADESRLRTDDGKWETVLHATAGMLGRTFDDPVFDIHYNARDEGGQSTATEPLRYALVMTLEAPRHVDLYSELLEAFPVLIRLEPTVTVSVPSS